MTTLVMLQKITTGKSIISMKLPLIPDVLTLLYSLGVSYQLFTFSQLQIEGVLGLQHFTAWCQTSHLVSQFLQLDVEMHLILCTGKLGTAGA